GMDVGAAGENEYRRVPEVVDALQRSQLKEPEAQASLGDPDYASAQPLVPGGQAVLQAARKSPADILVKAFPEERAPRHGMPGGIAQGRSPHGGADGSAGLLGPALVNEAGHCLDIAAFVIAEAGPLSGAFAMGAEIEENGAIAGAIKIGDAIEHVFPITAHAVEECHGGPGFGRLNDPPGQSNAIRRATAHDFRRQAEVSWRGLRPSRRWSRQPAGDAVGRRRIAHAGSQGESRQEIGNGPAFASGRSHPRRVSSPDFEMSTGPYRSI